MDAPVLDACVVRDGAVYRLTNQVADGCNRNPEMPVHRFIELLSGISVNKPNPGKAAPGSISPPTNP
jgi:hypothetical protein